MYGGILVIPVFFLPHIRVPQQVGPQGGHATTATRTLPLLVTWSDTWGSTPVRNPLPAPCVPTGHPSGTTSCGTNGYTWLRPWSSGIPSRRHCLHSRQRERRQKSGRIHRPPHSSRWRHPMRGSHRHHSPPHPHHPHHRSHHPYTHKHTHGYHDSTFCKQYHNPYYHQSHSHFSIRLLIPCSHPGGYFFVSIPHLLSLLTVQVHTKPVRTDMKWAS